MTNGEGGYALGAQVQGSDFMAKLSFLDDYNGVCSFPEESVVPSAATSFCNGVRSERTVLRISRTRSKKEGLWSNRGGAPFAKGTILGLFILTPICEPLCCLTPFCCTGGTVVVSVCLSDPNLLVPSGVK